MKKLTLILVCMALMLSTAACSRNNNDNMSSSDMSLDSVLEPAEGDEDNTGDDTDNVLDDEDDKVRFSNEDVEIVLEMDKPHYTVNDQIGMKVTVTNTGDQAIAYVHGSGSNMVPDALRLRLSELVDLFTPFMMTNDYRTEFIQPGETLTFNTPFAPYTANNEDVRVEPDSPIDFFQSDDFTPAQTGTVEGKVVFTYYLAGDNAGTASSLDAQDEVGETENLDGEGEGLMDGILDGERGALDIIDQGNEKTLEGTFQVDIRD